MSAVTLFALLLQATSVVLLRHRLGKTWLRRPVVILVLASVVYQGVSPVLLAIPSIGAQDTYRLGVAQSYADNATLLLSAAMLAFTVAYLVTRPERAGDMDAGPVRLARMPDWRIPAVCCAPLAVFTYEGRGYNNAAAISPGAPASQVLASSFFVLLVALAAFSLVLRKGPGWFLPVLILQSVLLAAAGERLPVVADAVVLIVLLCHAGMRPSGRQLAVAGALTLAAVMAITGVRAQAGRTLFYRDSGLGARVSALGSSVTNLGGTSPQGRPGLAAQAAVRLDGADFTAAVMQSGHFGQPRLPASGVARSLLLAVPSAVWPSKLSGSGLNPVQSQISAFGLQQVNFLPGFPGLYAGFLPPAGLIALLAFLGLLAGWGERWLLRSASPARMVMLAGAVITALGYEGGLPSMLVSLRAAAVVSLAAWGISALRSRALRPAQPAPGPSPARPRRRPA